MIQHQAQGLAVLGEIGDPVLDRATGRAVPGFLPLDMDAPLVQRIHAGDGPSQLCLARAHQTGHAHDLALLQREVHAVQDAFPPDTLHTECILWHGFGQVGVLLLDLASDHLLDHGVKGQVRDIVGAHVLAVPQDGDPVAQLVHLGVAVRDVDKAHVLFLL